MNPLMLWVAVAFAAGIVFAEVAAPSLAGSLAVGGLCLGLALLAARQGWVRVGLGLGLGGFLAAGVAAWLLFPLRIPSGHVSRVAESGFLRVGNPVHLEGWVSSQPRRKPDRVRFDLEVQGIEHAGAFVPAQGIIRLQAYAQFDSAGPTAFGGWDLQYGDRLRIWARLRQPRNFRNPGSFDYRRRLRDIEDVYLTGTLLKGHPLEKIGRKSGSGWGRLRGALRRKLLEAIDRLYPPWLPEGRSGALLKAMLLGDRTSLDRATVEGFQKSGLYHLLVISGLHLGLLALISHRLLQWLRLSEGWRILAVIAIVSLYCALIDLRAPTLRALLMVTVYLLGRLLAREHALLNATGVAGFLILLARPAWLFETGFQLSFAAVLLIAGLVLPLLAITTEPYRKALGHLEDVEWDGRLPPRVAQLRLDLRAASGWLTEHVRVLGAHPNVARGLVRVPLQAAFWIVNSVIFTGILQIGLLLPMVESFHRVSWVGIVLNAVAIPVMGLILAMGIPLSILGAVWPVVGELAASLLHPLLSLLVGLTRFELSEWLAFRVSSPPAWVSVGFGISWLALAVSLKVRRGRVWAASGATLCSLLIAFCPFRADVAANELEFTALDVGYGDALFLAFPDRTTMLVDGGGPVGRRGSRTRFDTGEEVVARYLWERRIRKIDVVVLSSFRQHHQAGLAAVLKNFQVGELWVGSFPLPAGSRKLVVLARHQSIPVYRRSEGQRFEFGKASVSVLWPPTESSLKKDEQVLVLRVEWGETGILLASDMPRSVARQVMARVEGKPFEVLKVAGHGARSAASRDFLESLRPRLAVISAGGLNPLRTPSRETLQRLTHVGAQVFRTDRDGAVTLRSDGYSLKVTTFRPRLPVQ